MSETEDFFILGEQIPLGGNAFLEFEVAKLHTHTPIKVPVIIERSHKEGPVVLLMAGVHGDEINGVAIIREVIQKKYNKPLIGTIICIPVFNIFGYLMQTREFPDGRDLNRMFPGTLNGSLASQFAYLFTHEIAPLADYIIDFHTGGADRKNVPQVRCLPSDEEAMQLARVFNSPFIVHSDLISKSVRSTLVKMGKTSLLFEGGKSRELDPEIVLHGVRGVHNVLRDLKMLSGKPEFHYETTVVKKSKWIRANHSGMFKHRVNSGKRVKKKEVLGVIQDPFGKFEKVIKAPFDCYVICVNTAPIINKGNALFHVSTELE